MPCSFSLLPHPRSGTRAQRNGRLRLTVTDRYTPLVTAACGTAGENEDARTWQRRLPARPNGLELGDYRIEGKPRTRRGSVFCSSGVK